MKLKRYILGLPFENIKHDIRRLLHGKCNKKLKVKPEKYK